MGWAALSELVPLYPLYALLFLDTGLSGAQISLLFAIWSITSFVAEIPAGVLADRWSPWLTAQDRQPWRPHVTVQNKVEPAVARALHAELAAGFVPFDTVAVGWEVFRHLGGPWEHVRRVPFAG